MTTNVLVMPIGTGEFGIGLEAVYEVLVDPTVTAVPSTSPVVLGLLNLRGTIVPVLDAGRLLGGPPVSQAAYSILIRCWAHDAALAVSGIPRLATLGEPVQPSETVGTTGTHRVGAQLVTMINPEALFTHAGMGVDQPGRTAG